MLKLLPHHTPGERKKINKGVDGNRKPTEFTFSVSLDKNNNIISQSKHNKNYEC